MKLWLLKMKMKILYKSIKKSSKPSKFKHSLKLSPIKSIIDIIVEKSNNIKKEHEK